MLSVKRYRCAIFSIWLTFFISPAQAEAVDGWQFSLAAGHGKISTVLSGRRPISGNFIPGVSYYGERFYLENTHLGYSLVENDYGYIDLVGELNDDGMFFELDGVNKFGWWDAIGIGRTDGGESPAHPENHYEDIERNLSYMAGISGNLVLADTTFRATFLRDVSGVHQGETQRFSVRRDFVPFPKLTLQLTALAEHKDQQLINYYYNFRPNELNNSPSWFSLPDLWNFSYGGSVNYQFDQHWSLMAHWQHHQMDKDIQRNPIILRADYQSKFVGVRYIF